MWQKPLNWLVRLKPDALGKTQRCNKEQQEIIGKVVHKIIEDEERRSYRRRKQPEQFLRLLHGGPGTGKSHVIKILKEELFEKELGWIAGIDFQIAAFQAVKSETTWPKD